MVYTAVQRMFKSPADEMESKEDFVQCILQQFWSVFGQDIAFRRETILLVRLRIDCISSGKLFFQKQKAKQRNCRRKRKWRNWLSLYLLLYKIATRWQRLGFFCQVVGYGASKLCLSGKSIGCRYFSNMEFVWTELASCGSETFRGQRKKKCVWGTLLLFICFGSLHLFQVRRLRFILCNFIYVFLLKLVNVSRPYCGEPRALTFTCL